MEWDEDSMLAIWNCTGTDCMNNERKLHLSELMEYIRLCCKVFDCVGNNSNYASDHDNVLHSNIVDLVSDDEVDLDCMGNTSVSTSSTAIDLSPSKLSFDLFNQFLINGRIGFRKYLAIVASSCLLSFRKEWLNSESSTSLEYITILNAGTILSSILHSEAYECITVSSERTSS